MDLLEPKGFPEFNPGRLHAYARERAAEMGLDIPDAYVPAVLENLDALQTHASILEARLKVCGPQTAQMSAS